MLKNYFKIAMRTFWKNKVFAAINILGLAIGISAAMVIFLIVHYDFSFDKFEKDSNRIFRITSLSTFSGESFPNSGVPDPMAEAVKKGITGIESTIPFHEPNFDVKVAIPSNHSEKLSVFKKQPNIVFADENYFNLLPYQWIAGSPKATLEPFKVVLSENRAKLYFPSLSFADIIGKEIIYNDSVSATIAGIVKDLNQNTDFIYKEFISLSTITNSGLKYNYGFDCWGCTNSSSQLFVKLAKSGSPQQIEKQLIVLLKKYDKNSNSDSKSTVVFHLQPLMDLHFNGTYGTFGDHLANKSTLYGLSLVGAFLLLLGCINFINLTTAQAVQRAKEIGIRKTMGSSKQQLVFQFLSETLFLTILATIISLALTPLLLKIFSDFIPRGLHFDLLNQPYLIKFLMALIILVTIFSGFYPALVLSRFQPAHVLKNQGHDSRGRKAWLRKTLTISQFIIAQFFIMATLIVSKQIYYSINKDLGYKKEAIIHFGTPFNYLKPDSKNLVLLDKIRSIPGIELSSMGAEPPASGSTMSTQYKFKDGKKETETDVQLKYADTNFIKVYQLKILAGRNLQPSDTIKEFIINATYMRVLGFQNPQDVINRYVEDGGRKILIVGVMADFYAHSLHEPIKPMALATTNKYSRSFHIALKPQNADGTAWKSTISKLEMAFKEVFPEDDFSYEFYDESIAKFYAGEQNISRLLKWATALAILISCLGLLGLVIYTTNQRTKEIGVRKVLGASVPQIVAILTKDFVKLVMVAFVIASPLAWWALQKWLQNFVYRTTISWWIFLVSGLFIVLMALITLSIQTIRAAVANPVKSLRTE